MTASTVAPEGADARWWADAAVYQIYLRSFADADGDGTGDLAGIQDRLQHLRDLGVDAVWINPWYPSPLRDGGYDVADFCDIDPRYGTLADAEALIAAVHASGMRILADLVPNHTSDRHAWFQRALAAAPGDPARDWYHFRPGSGPDGTEPPTDWRSVFGGPAWTRLDDGQWYLHLFDVTQPDLNWANPEVRAAIDDVLRFWLDRGVDGFRVDVAHGLAKDDDYPDVGHEAGLLESDSSEDHPFWDRDELHEIVRGWRAVLDTYEPTRVLLAEAWVTPERLGLYLRPDEYHQSFDFDVVKAEWSAASLGATVRGSLRTASEAGAAATWVLSNHDVVRHATRYGLPPGTAWRAWLLDGPHDALDRDLGLRRARAATLLILALPGSAYLYQGEELGLHEVHDLPLDVLDDPVWERSEHTAKGRDGCRVPIPWTTDGPSFGFGSGASWLPQPAWFGDRSVEAQTGEPDSTLEMYRAALRWRRVKRDRGLNTGEVRWLTMAPDVVSFVDRSFACVTNFGSTTADLPAEWSEAPVVISSGGAVEGTVAADTTVWLDLDATGGG